MMSQMMRDRMAHMGEGGCDPADMRRRMAESFGEAPHTESQGR